MIAAVIQAALFWLRASRPEAFGAYFASGRAASHGLDPYATYSMVGTSMVTYHGQPHPILDINMNPPCLLPLFQVLAHLGLTGFAIVLTLISAACLGTAVYLLMPQVCGWKLAWICLCAAALDTVLSGQIYFLLMLLVVIGLRKSEAIGMGLLAAVKPTFILWPLFTAIAGRWRVALQSFAVTLALWASAWLAYGTGVYRSWFHALHNDMHWLEPTDIAVAAWIARLANQRIGLIVAAICILGLAVMIYRTRPTPLEVAGLGLCAGVLLAPLGWAAYAIIAAPAFVLTQWGRLGKFAAVLLCIPVMLIVLVFPNPTTAILMAGVTYTAGVAMELAHFALKNKGDVGLTAPAKA